MKCENCFWFDDDPDNKMEAVYKGTGGDGVCCRFPLTASKYSDDRCGEYRKELVSKEAEEEIEACLCQHTGVKV